MLACGALYQGARPTILLFKNIYQLTRGKRVICHGVHGMRGVTSTEPIDDPPYTSIPSAAAHPLFLPFASFHAFFHALVISLLSLSHASRINCSVVSGDLSNFRPVPESGGGLLWSCGVPTFTWERGKTTDQVSLLACVRTCFEIEIRAPELE